MSDTTMDPKAIAQAVAIEVADEDGQVGDFVEAIDLGDNVTDFRFETCIRGYEGWQWSVTLYHDVELDHWTVNESSLVPTDKALRPPEWIPWKDRLEPTDLAVTDSIGTDPDDPRMEEGFRRTEPVESAESVSDDVQTVEAADGGDIALVENGDMINIDIPARTISLEISDAEMDARREKMKAKGDLAYKPVRDRKVSKALQSYAKSVSSAADGAVRKL